MNPDKIRLVRPTAEMKDRVLEFRQEFFDNGETIINGGERLDRIEDYNEWLEIVTKNANPETVSPDWVVIDTFLAVDNNDKIVGIIDFRHELNDFFKDSGNSGYSVRPSERRKGYAGEMLRQLLDIARKMGFKEFRLTAKRQNEPSVKTIVKNGGVVERSFSIDGKDADMYKIVL